MFKVLYASQAHTQSDAVVPDLSDGSSTCGRVRAGDHQASRPRPVGAVGGGCITGTPPSTASFNRATFSRQQAEVVLTSAALGRVCVHCGPFPCDIHAKMYDIDIHMLEVLAAGGPVSDVPWLRTRVHSLMCGAIQPGDCMCVHSHGDPLSAMRRVHGDGDLRGVRVDRDLRPARASHDSISSVEDTVPELTPHCP